MTPTRRLEIARRLGLDIQHELRNQTRWSIERLIVEMRDFAEELGRPDLMPMQLEMMEYGRQDLRAAVQKYGGQSKVAE